jgi:hypothetical protein
MYRIEKAARITMVKVIIEPPCFGLEKIFVPDSYVDLMIFYVYFLVMGKLMPTSCGTIPESGKGKHSGPHIRLPLLRVLFLFGVYFSKVQDNWKG